MTDFDERYNAILPQLKKAERKRKVSQYMMAFVQLVAIVFVIFITYVMGKLFIIPTIYHWIGKEIDWSKFQIDQSFQEPLLYFVGFYVVCSILFGPIYYFFSGSTEDTKSNLLNNLFPDARFWLESEIPEKDLLYSSLFPQIITNKEVGGMPALCYGMVEYKKGGTRYRIYDIGFRKNTWIYSLYNIPVVNSILTMMMSLSMLLNKPQLNPLGHQFRGLFITNRNRRSNTYDSNNTLVLSRRVSQYFDPNSEAIQALYNTQGKEVVVLEDQTFTEYFKVFGHQIESRKLLRPSLMEEVNNYQNGLTKQMRLGLGDSFNMAISNSMGYFDIGASISYLDKEYLKNTVEDIEAAVAFAEKIEELRI